MHLTSLGQRECTSPMEVLSMRDNLPLTTSANYAVIGGCMGQLVKHHLVEWKVSVEIHVLLNTSEPRLV